jgi:hypothetical protein
MPWNPLLLVYQYNELAENIRTENTRFIVTLPIFSTYVVPVDIGFTEVCDAMKYTPSFNSLSDDMLPAGNNVGPLNELMPSAFVVSLFYDPFHELYSLGRKCSWEAEYHWPLPLPTAASRLRSHIRSCWICGEQSDTFASFLQVLGFPWTILPPPTAPYSLLILSSTLRNLDNDSVVKLRSFLWQSAPMRHCWQASPQLTLTAFCSSN